MELLVTVAVIGILGSLLLPAVMHAREASRRVRCVSHLHQLGIAIHHHHDVEQRLPAAWQATETDPNFAYGWAMRLAPQFELGSWSGRLNRKRRPAFLTAPQQAARLMVPSLLCPSDITRPSFVLLEEAEGEEEHMMSDRLSAPEPLMSLPTANYVGVYGTHEPDDFGESNALTVREFANGALVNELVVRLRDLRQGTSHTLMVGERQMATVPSTWLGIDQRGQDAGCRVAGAAMTGPNCDQCDECEFTSRHPGGVNFVWADGHVSLLANTIDQRIYRQQAQRTPFSVRSP